jgi:hypothetical protein
MDEIEGLARFALNMTGPSDLSRIGALLIGSLRWVSCRSHYNGTSKPFSVICPSLQTGRCAAFLGR